MHKFILKLSLFCLGLLIINLLFYAIVYKIYLKDYEKIKLNYKTYLLADSHGVELGQLPEQYGVFNFSAVSDSYFDMLFKIRYLVRNTDVKKIIISVDDHAFSKYREYTNNTDRSIFFESRHDCDNRYNYFRDRYIKRYIVLINSKSRDIVKLFLKSKLLESNQKPPVKIWATLSPEEQKDLSLIRYK